MDQIWLAAPSPAMRLRRGAGDGFWRINDAARSWAERESLDAAFWPATAEALHAALSQSDDSEVAGTRPVPWASLVLDDGWLVWFSPPPRPAVPLGRIGSADKLALVQEFITIGVFERNLRTQEAIWDPQMFKLFGVDAAGGVPTIQAAARHVHPEDLERFRSEGQRFLRDGGRHALRYRVVWPDGSVHDLHSLIDVRFGHDLVSFTQDAEGVTAQLRTTAGDNTSIRCAYLVGCGPFSPPQILQIQTRGGAFQGP